MKFSFLTFLIAAQMGHKLSKIDSTVTWHDDVIGMVSFFSISTQMIEYLLDIILSFE